MPQLIFAAALAAAAVQAPPPAAPDLAGWLAQHSDVPPRQVAIVGADHVYSVEPLGPRTAAGEVIALVRTEPTSDAWGAGRRFQSWDAHLLFDCARRRVRVIRSATYPQRNRGGTAASEAPA